MADSKQKSNKDESQKVNKKFNSLDSVAVRLLNMMDKSFQETQILDSKNKRFQEILNRELDVQKGISNGSIIDFARYVRAHNQSPSQPLSVLDGKSDPYTILANNAGELFSIFQENYKNKYIEIQDLNFISKFIPALGQSVRKTIDYICSADELTDTILRNIELPESVSPSDKNIICDEIEKLEKQYKIQKYIKNYIIKNALISGKSYVYCIPYKKLFKEFEKVKTLKAKNGEFFSNFDEKTAKKFNTFNGGKSSTPVKESAFSIDDNIDDLVLESVLLSDSMESIINSSTDDKEVAKSLMKASHDLSGFHYINSSIPYPVLEHLSNYNDYKRKEELDIGKTNYETSQFTSDAVYSDPQIEKENKLDKNNPYEDVSDVYIKILDFKRIIPIKIFNKTIGYYYFHEEKKKIKDTTNRSTIPGVLDTFDLNQNRKENIIENLIQGVTKEIVTKFSPSFIANNGEFKQAIADCLIANNFTDKDYKIQFIPAEDVIEFIIDEDDNGDGTSILKDSLFPAKLKLSIEIAKILNYINKSGNRTVFHTYKSGVDPNAANQTQKIIRNLQESDANFTDMLSTNILFSKVSRNSNIHIPQSKDGKKLVEFETLEGQNIDMNTEYEKDLEKQIIMSTGNPSVMLEYIDQIDFAKQITTTQIDYAAKISSYQEDLSAPTTELYKRLLLNSDLNDDYKKLIEQNFSISFPKPKVLNNANINEYISNMQQMSNTVSDILYGQNINDEDLQKEKQYFATDFLKKNVPFIDWQNLEEMMKDAKIRVKGEKNLNNLGRPENADNNDFADTTDEDFGEDEY